MKETDKKVTDETKDEKKSEFERFKNRLPDWIARNLNWKSMVPVLRCAIAAWVGLIFLLDSTTLKVLGNAAFFILIACFLNPPSDSPASFGLASVMMLSGALLGWAWGCIGMRAALAARDLVLTQQQIRRAGTDATINGNTSIDAAIQAAVFNGVFIETGPAIIMIAFLAVLVVLAIVRTLLPRFQMFAVFGMIVGDVMLTYGPLFPTAQYTLAEIFIIPMCVYVAIGLASTVVILPTSSNRKVCGMISKIFALASSIHSDILLVLKTPCRSAEFKQFQRLDAVRLQISGLSQGLEASISLLEMEISIGRLSAEDIKAITKSLKDLLYLTLGLRSYYDTLVDLLKKEDKRNEKKKSEMEPKSELNAKIKRKEKKTRTREQMEAESTGIFETLQNLRLDKTWKPEDLSSKLDRLSSAILPSLEETLTVSKEALLLLSKIFNGIEEKRFWSWITRDKADSNELKDLQEAKEKLQNSITTFESEKRHLLIESYPDLLNSDSTIILEKGRANNSEMRCVFIGLKTQFSVIENNKYILQFITQIEMILSSRTTSRPWFSTSLRALVRQIKGRDKPKGLMAINQSTPEEIKRESGLNKAKARNPDVVYGNSPLKWIGRGILSVFRFLFSTPSIVGLRTVIVTILLALPQVYKPSAHFMYINKSLWALIMAQFGVTAFVGDHFFSYFFRVLGTFAGAVVGMVVWYIGNGNGTGSTYGTAAVCAMAFIVFMFARLHGPPPMTLFTIMTTVTACLVIGYSWLDGHLLQLGSPGRGWEVAWKRFLLVTIGLTAASVVMLFPKPSTGKRELRHTYARTLKECGEMHSYLTGIWMSNEGIPSKEYYSHLTKILYQVLASQMRISMAKFEPSLEGSWPEKRYQNIMQLQLLLIRNMFHIAQGLKKLNPKWRNQLLMRTAILDSHLIGDISAAWYMVSSSLQSKLPLPQITPGPLSERAYYHSHVSQNREGDEKNVIQDGKEKENDGSEPPNPEEPLTKTHLQNIEFIPFANCIVAHFQNLRVLDELIHEVKELVGESQHVEGYEALWNLKEEV